jgi:hypothetical protein
MPTKRTIQQLYDLFAPGQNERSITPDRVQDLIFTLIGAHGRISATEQKSFTLTTNVWQKVDIATELGAGARQFSMPQDGRLRCDCVTPSYLSVSGFLTFQANSASEFQVAIFKDSEIEVNTVVSARIPPGGGSATVPLNNDFISGAGEFLEVYIRRIDNTATPTVEQMYLSAWTRTL